MITEEQSDAEESARVLAAAKTLAEYFDCVVVMASRHDGAKGATRTIAKGAGNWHTQYGIVREWLIDQDERVRADARRAVES